MIDIYCIGLLVYERFERPCKNRNLHTGSSGPSVISGPPVNASMWRGYAQAGD